MRKNIPQQNALKTVLENLKIEKGSSIQFFHGQPKFQRIASLALQNITLTLNTEKIFGESESVSTICGFLVNQVSSSLTELVVNADSVDEGSYNFDFLFNFFCMPGQINQLSLNMKNFKLLEQQNEVIKTFNPSVDNSQRYRQEKGKKIMIGRIIMGELSVESVYGTITDPLSIAMSFKGITLERFEPVTKNIVESRNTGISQLDIVMRVNSEESRSSNDGNNLEILNFLQRKLFKAEEVNDIYVNTQLLLYGAKNVGIINI